MKTLSLLLVLISAAAACTKNEPASSPSSQQAQGLTGTTDTAPDAGTTQPPGTAPTTALTLAPAGSAPTGTAPISAGSPTKSPEPSGPWTSEPVEKKSEGMPLTLQDIRSARNEGFDRTVFELQGDKLSGYRVEYTDELVACGSGNPIPLQGAAKLSVQLRPARAHTEQGEPTIANIDRTTSFPTLLQAKQSCDFEGAVVWGLGLKARKQFRVTELSSPSRIVVDVQH